MTGACYLQRDAAKLYAEAQAFTKLADEVADGLGGTPSPDWSGHWSLRGSKGVVDGSAQPRTPGSPSRMMLRSFSRSERRASPTSFAGPRTRNGRGVFRRARY
jgi:hypothetical protein